MIRKVGSKYRLVSHTGKNLGESDTVEGAQKREKQVQYFKNLHKYLADHPGSKGFPK